MSTDWPLLVADLTFVRVNGGRAYSGLVHWEEDHSPTVGEQQILVADGGSDGPFEAVITEIRGDGTLGLVVAGFARTEGHRSNGS